VLKKSDMKLGPFGEGGTYEYAPRLDSIANQLDTEQHVYPISPPINWNDYKIIGTQTTSSGLTYQLAEVKNVGNGISGLRDQWFNGFFSIETLGWALGFAVAGAIGGSFVTFPGGSNLSGVGALAGGAGYLFYEWKSGGGTTQVVVVDQALAKQYRSIYGVEFLQSAFQFAGPPPPNSLIKYDPNKEYGDDNLTKASGNILGFQHFIDWSDSRLRYVEDEFKGKYGESLVNATSAFKAQTGIKAHISSTEFFAWADAKYLGHDISDQQVADAFRAKFSSKVLPVEILIIAAKIKYNEITNGQDPQLLGFNWWAARVYLPSVNVGQALQQASNMPALSINIPSQKLNPASLKLIPAKTPSGTTGKYAGGSTGVSQKDIDKITQVVEQHKLW
jgi:hypothetical protein